MATTVETSMSSQITNMIRNDSDHEKAAFRLANQVENQESLLMKLYAAPEFSTKEAEQKFLKDNGLAKYGTLEGARQAIQIKYQRTVKAMEFFLQLMKNRFDILRGQIQKLDLR